MRNSPNTTCQHATARQTDRWLDRNTGSEEGETDKREKRRKDKKEKEGREVKERAKGGANKQ